jgi:phospholipase C
MVARIVSRSALLGLLALGAVILAAPARADGDLRNLQHIVIVMQENHSFDNYFGALPYVPGGPYHSPRGLDHDHDGDDVDDDDGCRSDDHRCVDGLACQFTATGALQCFNANVDAGGSLVPAFHDPRRCVAPDLDHEWVGTHHEGNFLDPNDTLHHFKADGFVRQNDLTEQIDSGAETPSDDQTMNFYNQDELPFYYGLAENFAISDRHFSSVLGPTFPNRAYSLAATSFGHLTTSDTFPPPGGYKPITGTIFDLMDEHGVTWADYFQDVPAGGSFRNFTATAVDPHFLPLKLFLAQAAGAPGIPPLPQVSFVDPDFGVVGGIAKENDEHPPTDIQRGQASVSVIINAIRNGPNWASTIVLLTYDEHGGFFDHVQPPRAPQGGERTPDGISPGQCEDLSNVPASLQPGGGAECSSNLLSKTNVTVLDAEALCPALTADPTGPFPAACASFDQLGVRVPFVAISPFSKPHYVSHVATDHTSVLALIEKRFMTSGARHASDGDGDADDVDKMRPHLTNRDLFASTMEDMFDFDRSPSLITTVGTAAPPVDDCTPGNAVVAGP